MSKHTPEPWELLVAESDKEYLRIRGTVLGGRYKIANVLWPNYSESAREREAVETLANAERIIDCVNACAGMADPAAEIAELKRQRDGLLAALHDAATSLETIQLRSFGANSFLDDKLLMREYAFYRALVAREAIAATKGFFS